MSKIISSYFLSVILLSLSNGEICSFLLSSPSLFVRRYSLPVFYKFSNSPHQTSLFQIFWRYSYLLCILSLFIRDIPFKRCSFIWYIKKIRVYAKIVFFQTRLEEQTKGIFSCCLVSDNKIEWFQSIMLGLVCAKEIIFPCVVKFTA